MSKYNKIIVYCLCFIFLIMGVNAAWNSNTYADFLNKDSSSRAEAVSAFQDSSIDGIGIVFDLDEVDSNGNLDSDTTDYWIDLANQYNKDVYFKIVPPEGSQNPDGTEINWNPGVYFGFKQAQILSQGVNGIPNILRNNAMCKPGGENVKGIRLKFTWGEFEERDGVYPGYEVIDEALEFFRNGECDGIERRVMIGLDFLANKNLAVEGKCAPEDLQDEIISWSNNAERERCAAPVWREGSESRERYEELLKNIAERYKDEPLIEYFTAKGEGALAVNDNDPTFTYDAALDYLLDLGIEVRNIAPSIPYVFGTNNFKAGDPVDNLMETFKPHMDDNPGFGLRWPDTFTKESWATAPYTSHHKFHGQFKNKHMMAGELQLAGNRYTSYEGVWQACCNPQGYNDPQGDNNAFDPPTSDHTWGTSHIVVITTFSDYPEEDAISTWDSHDWQMYSSHCPDDWVSNGAKCVTGKTDANPGYVTTNSDVSTKNDYLITVNNILDEYSNENNFKGFFTEESSGGSGDSGNFEGSTDSDYCHKIGGGDHTNYRYATPYDVNTNELYMKTQCTSSQVSLSIGEPNSNLVIYKNGYYWNGASWIEMDLQGNFFRDSSDWIKDSASYDININTEFQGYIIAYICKWDGSEWKCGCKDSSCSKSFWNLQIYQK